ncbi:MAG: GNAT family N-acetyltransferase [Treponema sp.]|nr:GNAT family N-acetyltransferase [Treponema sp.]
MTQFSAPYTWYMLENHPPPDRIVPVEAFLQAREAYCVAAAARFLQRGMQDQIWVQENQYAGQGSISGLIILSKGALFPVFNGISPESLTDFLVQGRQNLRFYAVQGIRKDVALLEQALALSGVCSARRVDYDLMVLDQEPAWLTARVPGLILRYAEPRDMESLFHLQAAYEQEEVILQGGVFNPALCRLSLEYIMTHEYLLLAQWKSKILGKINTNAASFSRYQIGGVYVCPDYRGLGIASYMGAAFVRNLLAAGRGFTLFVKKRNSAAREAYLRIGFKVLEDYRISYYEGQKQP